MQNNFYVKNILSKIRHYLIIVSFSFILPTLCWSQQISAQNKLTHQLECLNSAFSAGDERVFDQIVELGSLRELFASVVKENIKRAPGKFRIIPIKGNTAQVFISGLFLHGNSGDETNTSTKYTGIYRFIFSEESWRLVERIEIDRLNIIKKQGLGMVVNPGLDVKIIDTLTIDVNDRLGFAAKLNHKAVLEKVLLNGLAVDYLFSGGMLWLNSQPKKNQQLIIKYSIETSSRMFEFVFKMLSEGFAAVPALGMGEISKQLSECLDNEELLLNEKIEKIENGVAYGNSGLAFSAGSIIIATDAKSLFGQDKIDQQHGQIWKQAHTLYFSADKKRLSKDRLHSTPYKGS